MDRSRCARLLDDAGARRRAADLAEASYDVDVVPPPQAVVRIDAAHGGLGTASIGPDTLPQYQLGPGTYRRAWSPRG